MQSQLEQWNPFVPITISNLADPQAHVNSSAAELKQQLEASVAGAAAAAASASCRDLRPSIIL
ncbi:hypothetical protein ACLOJK_031394 [Asimina triloba]